MEAKEGPRLPWREILEKHYAPGVEDNNWGLEQVRKCWERCFQEDEIERLHAVSECSGRGLDSWGEFGVTNSLEDKKLCKKRNKTPDVL